MHRGQHEHCMFDAVFRQDGDGMLRTDSQCQESARQTKNLIERLLVGDAAPRSVGSALEQKRALGRALCPVQKILVQASRIGPKRLRRIEQNAPIWASQPLRSYPRCLNEYLLHW